MADDDREAWVSINWDQPTGTNARKLLADIVRRRNERLDREATEWSDSRPDPRTVAVPADATVHLRRQDEDRVTVDDFGPGAPTVAVMRQSWQGAMRSLADLGEQVRAITAERDDLAERLAQAALDRDRERADGNLAAQQAREWMDEAVRQAAYRDALAELAVLYVPLDMRRGTALDPTWTPDAPAGPPSEPVAAQEPPAGGIGPTETQRGSEGVPPAPRMLTWDWREQPDLDQLARALHDLTGGAIGLHQVDTGSDQYAIVLASTPLTPEQAHAVWAADDPNAGGEG